MDGIHDMGGMHGFGKVEPEKDEPVFHAAWEGHVLALQRAMRYADAFTIDQSRAAIEELPPDVYLSSSYYKRWAWPVLISSASARPSATTRFSSSNAP